MSLPPRLTFVTVGTRDMPRLRSFYKGLGWHERSDSSDEFAAFDLGTTRLALYPLARLGGEAAPGEPAPAAGWNGVTFGVNVESADAVDDAFRLATAAGARVIADPVRRDWGGYSGYFADPEGNRWELAWAPFM